MKKHLSKIIALACVAAIVLSFAACNGGKEPTTTKPSTTGTTGVTETTTGTTGTNTTNTTVTGTTNTTVTGTTTPTNPTGATYLPKSKSIADIVTFYNTCANKTKAASKITIKRDEDKTKITVGSVITAETKEPAPAFMLTAIKTAVDKNCPKENDATLTFTNGKAPDGTKINDFLPVEGKTYLSKLPTSGAISPTSYTVSGDICKVKIYIKTENDVNPGTGAHGTCMNVLEKSSVVQDFGVGRIKKATFKFSGSTITAEINTKTGFVTKVTTDMKVTGKAWGVLGTTNIEGIIGQSGQRTTYYMSNIK